MSFYTRLQATVNKMLKGKGQSLTLTHITPGTYNPAIGSVTNTTTTQAAYGAIFEYDTKQAGIFSAPGSLIQMGDKQLLLSPFKTDGTSISAPANGDTVTDVNGKIWTITQVKTISPAGTVIMYDCNLRA